MHPLPADALAFLTPGLLHQLGNQLFAIQGQAQLLPPDQAAVRDRLLDTVARGADVLRVVRAMLGDAAPVRLRLAEALAPLLDLLRIAARERGHRLAWSADDTAAAATVDAHDVVAAVARAALALFDVVPPGVTGSLAGRAVRDGSALAVELRFVPAAGALPFPLATAEARTRWLGSTPAPALAARCRAVEGGLSLLFPLAARPAAAEA
ncbi:MAG: hypothetical protein JNL08_15835 [Planctomycetes bacterium]|nr:hypothetical protein [Planctomycetota bacterium]